MTSSPEHGSSVAVDRNPLNIDSADFDCEAFLSHLIKKKSLPELLEVENAMVQEVRGLDSEMQQLVYENYNKFIIATGTVRKMRTDLAGMEQKMDALVLSMNRITDLSERVGGALSGQRENVSKLAVANRTLKGLEFLFELPKKLSNLVERKEYAAAVTAYNGARRVLERYKDVPSLFSIYDECGSTMEEVREQLKERLRRKGLQTDQIAEAFSLLGELDEPLGELASELLDNAESHLSAELDELEDQVRLKSGDNTVMEQKIHRPSDAVPNLPFDILEFVDTGCSQFLSNVSLVGVAYSQLVTGKQQESSSSSPIGNSIDFRRQLADLVDRLMNRCFDIVERRFALETDPSESGMVVRALDRFHRRLSATGKVFTGTSYTSASLSLVLRVAERHIGMSHERLFASFEARIKDSRTQLGAGGNQRTALLLAAHTGSPARSAHSHEGLNEHLSKMEQSLVHDMKTALANLLQFVAYDVHFCSPSSAQPQSVPMSRASAADDDDDHFSRRFGVSVREKLIVAFFSRVVQLADDFCYGRGDKAYVNATLILVMSRLCKNLEASTVGYVLDLCEQQFRIGSGASDKRRIGSNARELTPSVVVTKKMNDVAQRLLDHYVEMEGFALSQLVVKSVETRDWVGCAEPRAVRAVMKRMVEDLTAIDSRVGQLFEEGTRKDRSSDSSRSRHTTGMVSGGTAGGLRRPPALGGGESAISSTLGKLWTERIDYFASVSFNKVSVLTGIVKICLKTLLESVRLRTFGKYGLQQVQVDCHYLQLYLWRFVFDEHLVYSLLDEVVSSALHRCIDPQVMEPSVVEVICDRG